MHEQKNPLWNSGNPLSVHTSQSMCNVLWSFQLNLLMIWAASVSGNFLPEEKSDTNSISNVSINVASSQAIKMHKT